MGPVTVAIPIQEWQRLALKADLCIDVLASIMDALAASPFAGMIPEEVKMKIMEINNL